MENIRPVKLITQMNLTAENYKDKVVEIWLGIEWLGETGTGGWE
jgi:hypothetical protein